ARKPKSLDGRVRTLKATFGWLKELKLVDANPFDAVSLPQLDRHEVKYVRQADVAEFFTWLESRYPCWRMPTLFFEVKAVTVCRLDDICNLRSDQLQDGRIVFTAQTAKTRKERYAKLPPELYAELKAYGGPAHLWERYPLELRDATAKRGAPVHRLN